MKSIKSFEGLHWSKDGRLTIESPEKIEIERLKQEIKDLQDDVRLEKEAHLETLAKLEQAMRDIKIRDERAPIGYLCKKTKTVSDQAFTPEDIPVYDKFDPFLYMSTMGNRDEVMKEAARGVKNTMPHANKFKYQKD